MTPLYTTHLQCRACRGDLTPVVDLGSLRLNAFPDTANGHLQLATAPLRLAVCRSCTLVQLSETVDQDRLYRHYWYRSSVNESMREELKSIVEDGMDRAGRDPKSQGTAVLDIGANDGTLLSYYPKAWWKIGIDPSENLQPSLRQHADTAYLDYFPTNRIFGARFDLITAIACCYDLEHPRRFFLAIRDHLLLSGRACVQFQDLRQQVACHAIDNVCHEHLEYYTLASLQRITLHAGLRMIDVETRKVNGGSLRVWLQPTEAPLSDRDREGMRRVWRQIAAEELDGYGPAEILHTLERFEARVTETIRQIHAALDPALEAGKTIDVYGASTKGNILLQILGIGPTEIRRAIDRDPLKTGRYTVTGIPIVDEAAPGDPAAIWLTPIWQFRTSVLERNQGFLSSGGMILFPLPSPEMVAMLGAVPI